MRLTKSVLGMEKLLVEARFSEEAKVGLLRNAAMELRDHVR